ncbi:F0F1 ATP synthase subunit delta [Microbacterium sp.]|uniref:F0F1 ATP synthase subunit delta n=1 Tax=Microbacterium sp. TaxID=51671 RepID=UPI0025F7F859|nr:F0F1 ATP synthase subunit delta [Microbacterium sp.]
MGSATTQARAESGRALDAASGVDLDVARELFAAARTLGDTPQLSGALAAAATPVAARQKLVTDVFGGFAPTTVSLLSALAAQRWSSSVDLVEGIEEIAVRAASIAEPGTDIAGELFAVSRTVADNPELELALGSRLGEASAKGTLIEALFAGRSGAATVLIASSLVRQPRDRRVRAMLTWAKELVAEQRGRIVGTVYSAVALSTAQRARLGASLGQRYGGQVELNVVVDPTVVGGLRVEIGDDVIDATVSSRLGDLRQRLAG